MDWGGVECVGEGLDWVGFGWVGWGGIGVGWGVVVVGRRWGAIR